MNLGLILDESIDSESAHSSTIRSASASIKDLPLSVSTIGSPEAT